MTLALRGAFPDNLFVRWVNEIEYERLFPQSFKKSIELCGL